MPFILVAQPTDQGQGSPFGIVILFGIVAMFYFMAVRPQRKQRQAHMELLRTIAVGDQIETIGGLFGSISRLDDELAWVDLAPGTTVKMARRAIRRKVEPQAAGGEG